MISRKSLLACATLLAMASMASAATGEHTHLDRRLDKALQELSARFIGHEAVAVPEDGHPKKYLLLDFEGGQPRQTRERQEQIHSICMQILKNRDLVRDLSRDGFHMVSVAFNRRFQYDCL